ncbi:MAG TPA: hypothetical protein VG710_08710 [Opitutus sp.]|nr:hypothetical protein [Opitutus sp.]
MNPTPSRFPSRPRGSALITVLLLSFLLITIAASVMNWSLTERRLNARSAYWLEARNAAEAVAEYGAAQVAKAFNTNLNPSFASGGTPGPITFPATLASSFFAGSRVDTSSLEIKVGNVGDAKLTYMDPSNPNNQYDPLIGRYVSRRDITVLAKATVNPPTGGGSPVTAYIMEKVSFRGAPLLAFAIFYSDNDLEFNETPQMDIYGPVHVNGNLFVGPAGSSPQPLSFHGSVTASGNVYHAWRGTSTTAKEGGSSMSSTTAVNFSTDTTTSGSPVNMRASDGTWKDSTMGADSSTSGLSNLQALLTSARNTSFSQYASQTWKGQLQTAVMGVQSYNPMGFNEVVAQDSSGNDIIASSDTADDGANVGTGSGYGHGYGPHSLIEPPLTVSSSDTYAAAKTSLEEQKFSRQAGLYLKVVVNSDGSLASSTLYADPNSGASPPTGTPGGTTVDSVSGRVQLGTVPSSVFQYIPYSTVDVTTSHTSHGTTTYTTNTYVNSGIFDQHQDVGVNLVQVNMQALKTALTDMSDSHSTTGTSGTDILTADNSTKWGQEGVADPTGFNIQKSGSTGWNGAIYVDVESSDSTHQTGVILANGKVTSGNSLTPMGSSAINGNEGLTVATNAPVYVLGNLNADGTVDTTSTSNSALYPDDKAGGTAVSASSESPMAIAADAVTVLSANFFGTGSGSGATNLVPSTNSSTSGSAYSSNSTNAPNASGSVEIAAAFISGTIETSPDSTGTQQYSGGVHNFPRFLETWSSSSGTQYSVAIRGSIVNMYKSRVATVGWSQSYYSAPVRQWGYDQIFANGKFPPIIPQVLSYRRIDFTYLSNAADYAAAVAGL